jgi:hypothetical protein
MLRQPMENNGYKHEDNNSRHEKVGLQWSYISLRYYLGIGKWLPSIPFMFILVVIINVTSIFTLAFIFMIIVRLSISLSCRKLINSLGLSKYLGLPSYLLLNLNM